MKIKAMKERQILLPERAFYCQKTVKNVNIGNHLYGIVTWDRLETVCVVCIASDAQPGIYCIQ